jgi:hypothetical protein
VCSLPKKGWPMAGPFFLFGNDYLLTERKNKGETHAAFALDRYPCSPVLAK